MGALLGSIGLSVAAAGKIMLVMIILNSILSAVGAGLDAVAKADPAPGLVKAASITDKIVSYSKMVVDFLSANLPH